MNDYSAMCASALAEATPLTPEEAKRAAIESKRAAATLANRKHKQAERIAALDSVGGDRESLCRIRTWEPRQRSEQMFARAFDRKSLFETGTAFHDECYEIQTVEYDLVEQIVPRARHPDEEVAFAKLQGRFREQTPSIQGFFHKPTNKSGDRRARRVMPAPLGDFEWCDRPADLDREQQIQRSLAALRAARPIRNVNESK